jgi:hypothetical protein
LITWRCGRQVELGKAIRITHRNYTRSTSIQLYHCVFQYKRCLKTERYVRVQVVLLLTLILIYQDYYLEVVLKYGGRDTSESSLVFSGSKDREAKSAGHYFHIPQSQTLKISYGEINLKFIKAKVLVSYGRKIPT